MKTTQIVVALLATCVALPVAAVHDGVGYVEPFTGEPYDINLAQMTVVDSTRSVVAQGCPAQGELLCLFTDVISFVVPKAFGTADRSEWTFGDMRYCALRVGASPAAFAGRVRGPVFTVWVGQSPDCVSEMYWQQRYLYSPTNGVLLAEYRRENGRVDLLLLHSEYGFGAPRVHR
jgi:hypothetical protein